MVETIDIPTVISESGIESRLEDYRQQLFAENETTNLVSRETGLSGFLKLAAESLLPLGKIIPEASSYLDVGSGGGFPSIPIILLRKFIEPSMLVERTQKKAFALGRICAALDLEVEIEPFNLADVKTGRRFDLITLRYVSLDEPLLKKISSLLSRKGQFLYYSKPEFHDLNGLMCTTYQYRLANDDAVRHYSIFQRP